MSNVLNLLYSSNSNGIGTFVFGILIYLSFYHFFLFIQNKKKYYLFYSIFALFNACQLFGILENVFFQSFFEEVFFRNSPLFYAFRTLAFMLFGMFMMDVTEAKKEIPKFYKQNYIILNITTPTIIVCVILDYYYNTTFSFYLFQYFFFPIFTIMTVVAVPLMLKFKTSIKLYLIIGVVSYNIINGLFYALVFYRGVAVEDNLMFLFYISLLIENLFFTLALGKKERELFLEKNKIQEEYISQLNENQQIKEELNERLEQKINKKSIELKLLNKKHLKEKEEKLELKLENLRQKINVESLQNQMNPHFIFNALNSIKAYLIENDVENGIFYINKFSKLIRGILDGLRKPHISLKKEYELLDIYVKIESIRIKEKINFIFENNTNIGLENIIIPPLLLQPLVENAICHGFLGKKDSKKIKITVEDAKDNIVIVIKDNGIGLFSKSKAQTRVFKNSYGLSLVRDRLDYFNQKKISKSDVLVLNNSNKGFTTGVSIELKLKKENCLLV